MTDRPECTETNCFLSFLLPLLFFLVVAVGIFLLSLECLLLCWLKCLCAGTPLTLIRSTVWFSLLVLPLFLPPLLSSLSFFFACSLSLFASFLFSATLTGLTTPLKALIQLCYDNRIPDLETIKDFFLMFEREYAPINLTFKLKVRGHVTARKEYAES